MQIVLDALSYRQAQRSAFQNPKPPVPTQRPGVAPPSYRADDGDVEAAEASSYPIQRQGVPLA